MTNYVNGAAALATLRTYKGMVPGHCLEACWNAYHAHGAHSTAVYATATAARVATPGMHAHDWNPPVGMPVWFGASAENNAGDVCISAGGGQVVGVWGTGVHQVSIAQRAAEIGRPYLGWTDHFMTDNAIVSGLGRNITNRPLKDIQAKLAIPTTGVFDEHTTWSLRAFQSAHKLTVDGVYGLASDGAMFPLHVVANGVDFSQGRPGVPALIGAAKPHVFRYVGAYANDPRATSAAEINSYLSGGVSVTLNYEGTGKDATSFANGVADATYAQAQLVAFGFPTALVYFSVDEPTAADPVAYFKGVESVMGHARTGVYGSIDTLTKVHAAGLCSKYWLTVGWQNNQIVPAWVNVYQWEINQTLNGAAVDFDKLLTADWGQIHPTVVAPPAPAPAPKPAPAPAPKPVVIPKFPLPAGYYFGPRSGPVQSVSGYSSHTADLKRWQTEAKAKGFYKGTPDGHWGPITDAACVAVQKHHHLTVDHKIGPVTWHATWI